MICVRSFDCKIDQSINLDSSELESSLRGLCRSKRQRKSDGCPMFAKAYMGRKRRAQPYECFCF